MNNVFKANPKADKLYVVGGVPFLKETHALNYAKGDQDKVKVVNRNEAKAKKGTQDPAAEALQKLKAEAKELKIKGYGSMSAETLEAAIAKAKEEADPA